jgi:hypothetical protein
MSQFGLFLSQQRQTTAWKFPWLWLYSSLQNILAHQAFIMKWFMKEKQLKFEKEKPETGLA